MRKVKLRGLAKVDWLFVFASAAFNLIRLPKLLPRARMTGDTCLHDTASRRPDTGGQRSRDAAEAASEREWSY